MNEANPSEPNPGGHSRSGLSRRGALQAGLIAAAGLGAGSWSPASAATRPQWWRRQLRKPGSLPYPRLAAGTDTIPQIRHIVVLMMENHSYDNRLGMLRRPGADGFRLGRGGQPIASNPYANGDIQHAFHMPTTCQNNKPSQEWTQSHIQFDGGRNDGFVISNSGPVAMGYWDSDDQPFYYSMAGIFPIGDRYFCSVLGQTYPNRRYLIAATSIGQIDDTTPALTDYPANGTIFDAVDAAGLTWKDYYTPTADSPYPTIALYPKLYLDNAGTRAVPIADFFTDAAAGTLPQVSLVEPNYDLQSEEDPQNIAVGEQFAASVINAVMSGPGWPSTLLIWTYDEHGGYYDHVPPPPALAPDNIPPDVSAISSSTLPYNGFRQYGFRVPMAVISPWARPHHVSHQVMDHTSICALIEAKWNLPAMTYRDANAWPMLDMLDLHRPAFLRPPSLALPLLATDPSALACNVSGPGTIPPPRSITPLPKRRGH
ncbi:MAG TPA: alkaline phosphatase family protein [Streptosporangiaceae bacterium]|nr:alkaline phosphatase family protein [Streptosporangiaceae bacterium]